MPPKRKKVAKTIEIEVKAVKVEDNGSNASIKQEKPSPEGKKAKKGLANINKKARKVRPVFACHQCTKRFRFKERFALHLRNEHSTLPNAIKCSECSARCPNETILQLHMEKFHERDIFECPHCSKQFVRHAHVLRHLAQKGCDGRGVVTYPCEICDASFTRKDNLMVHLKMQHISDKEFKCKQCAYSSRKFTKLIVHTQNMHMEKPLKYECDHCGRVTGSRASMAKHLEIHGEKKYSCDVCGYSTFTIEVMRRHVLTHVMDKPYKCDACNRSFIQRSQLDKHLAKHVGKKCPRCDKHFPSEVDVIIHQRDHSDVQVSELTCPIEDCPVTTAFPNAKALKLHVKRHTLEKPFACEVCGRRCRTEMDMRRHLSHHTLERPRRCMYCVVARAYVRGEQLVRHVRKAHTQVFEEHLKHVRKVLNITGNPGRVKKSELDAILNVLDAEADRILQDYGEGVLYGGMQETDGAEEVAPTPLKVEPNPLMSEEELMENLKLLLSHLIDKDLLECFGWPDETVDRVLEKVIEHCGAKPADREKWSRVQCLRENSKHLFLYVVEDKNIARMLDTHTIDQVILNILSKISEDEEITPDK